ncbi:MAG TPA: hypothetical protein VHL77_07725 [Ferruginibacter sp.]|jgi:hypothetical protein|nr:hypothetical protein [Ferruginibacter sp.]
MRIFLMMTGLLLSSAVIFAQKNYAVMVTDARTSTPIKGAFVIIKSTGKTVSTSEFGNVVVFASPEDSLQVKFKGYKDRQIGLAEQSIAISIEMEPKPVKPVAAKPKKKH